MLVRNYVPILMDICRRDKCLQFWTNAKYLDNETNWKQIAHRAWDMEGDYGNMVMTTTTIALTKL